MPFLHRTMQVACTSLVSLNKHCPCHHKKYLPRPPCLRANFLGPEAAWTNTSNSLPQALQLSWLVWKHRAMPERVLACLGKLGVDLGRVAADAHHLGQILELRVLVPEQPKAGHNYAAHWCCMERDQLS